MVVLEAGGSPSGGLMKLIVQVWEPGRRVLWCFLCLFPSDRRVDSFLSDIPTCSNLVPHCSPLQIIWRFLPFGCGIYGLYDLTVNSILNSSLMSSSLQPEHLSSQFAQECSEGNGFAKQELFRALALLRICASLPLALQFMESTTSLLCDSSSHFHFDIRFSATRALLPSYSAQECSERHDCVEQRAVGWWNRNSEILLRCLLTNL